MLKRALVFRRVPGKPAQVQWEGTFDISRAATDAPVLYARDHEGEAEDAAWLADVYTRHSLV